MTMSDKTTIRVVESAIVRIVPEVDEDTGEVWVVAYDRDGKAVTERLAFEAVGEPYDVTSDLNNYHNKETN